tara:strand:- start:909 stop:1304 length:396 start_codon:yes stop_codon:yes gene_type:complete
MSIQLGDIQLQKAYTKPLHQALSEIFGIGYATSTLFCKSIGLSSEIKLGSLSRYKQNFILTKFSHYLSENGILIDHELATLKSLTLSKLRSIKSYRGVRNFQGLPVRGQRTETNASTQKKRGGRIGSFELN